MAFHDVRLPVDVERGAQGGPVFQTTVLRLASGAEQRNQEHAESKQKWDISYGVLDDDGDVNVTDFNDVRDFFYARLGRLHSWPFKDHSDFTIGDALNPTTDNQTIGTGDAIKTVFQIIKTYTSGAFTNDRTITKPIVATTIVLLDNVVQVSGFTVARLTGIVTFAVPPGAGVVVGVVTEFDLVMRFDTDAFDLNVIFTNAASIPSLPIVDPGKNE